MVTPVPVWPIEPIVIVSPMSARIELLRPRTLATALAVWLKSTAPVTRAGKSNKVTWTSPWAGEGNLGLVPAGRYAVVAVGEPGSALTPSTVDRSP